MIFFNMFLTKLYITRQLISFKRFKDVDSKTDKLEGAHEFKHTLDADRSDTKEVAGPSTKITNKEERARERKGRKRVNQKKILMFFFFIKIKKQNLLL